MTLEDLKNFIAENKILIFLIIAIIVSPLIFIGFYFSSKNSSLGWQNKIFPGKTTKEQVIKFLGQPDSVSKANNKEALNYKTSNKYRFNKIEISKEKVSLVKEQVLSGEEGKLDNFVKKLGEPEAVLTGTRGMISPANFWGKKGIIVFANKKGGEVVEIWYIIPTTLSQFLSENTTFNKVEDLYTE